MSIKDRIIWIAKEVRHGNEWVIIGIIVATIYVGIPMYEKFLDVVDYITASKQVDVEVGANMTELWEEINKIKAKQEEAYQNRKPGVLGKTGF